MLGLLVAAAPRVHACAVCFGNTDSNMAHGMLAGVLVLLFVVLSVLGGFVALFVYLARKSAEAAAADQQSNLVSASGAPVAGAHDSTIQQLSDAPLSRLEGPTLSTQKA